MEELFSEDLQNLVLKISKKIATDLNSLAITPAHFILGIIREKIGLAYFLISNIVQDNMDEFEKEVSLTIARAPVISPLSNYDFNANANACLKYSKTVMQKFNDHQITPEHLLISIIYNSKGTDLYDIFMRYGITEEKVTDILKKFGNDPYSKIKKKPKSNISTMVLDRFCKDLTELAWLEQLDPIIGREKEIERVIQVLSRRMKNNPILIGYPGVGKTAIVEGLAQRIIAEQVPKNLFNKRILKMEMGTIVAGTKYRGEFEERMSKILSELSKTKNCILFIDEIHTIVGAGGAEGAIDASNMLKPFLARGEVQIIGATTFDEYKKRIEKDQALERRFQPIVIDEPSEEETLEILKGIASKYEDYHKVKYSEEVLKYIVELSKKYINDRFLPDKAIDILDESGSYINIIYNIPPNELQDIRLEMKRLTELKENYFRNKEYEKLPQIQEKLNYYYNKYILLKSNWEISKVMDKEHNIVTKDIVAEVVSRMTGINVEKLKTSETERLVKMQEILKKFVVGQDEAIEAVSRAIKRGRLGIKKLKKPIGSFIFLGPTGVGKTELARRLAEFLFGTQEALIRIDMSDFMEKHNVSRLVGAPPGYIGYEEGGELTEKVRRKPYSLILFDEIEKAHPDFFNMLLQVLEEGELFDNLGHRVDFKNTIIIMTSNIGAKEILSYKAPGFNIGEDNKLNYADIKSKVLNQLKKSFNPEFLNRVDDFIIFHPLEKEHLYKIIDIMIEEVQTTLKNYKIKIEISDSAKDYLIEKGADSKYGARPLRRLIQKEIEDLLSDLILKGEAKEDSIVKFFSEKGLLKFKIEDVKKSEKNGKKVLQK
ncbi:MAG: ATP-dependent Clp protease ATP-binding subunit [Spirochaetes bacterium]|nr:ATP-dependent Clp protease ATP-binding subunit [Spirochaetota bacterium]